MKKLLYKLIGLTTFAFLTNEKEVLAQHFEAKQYSQSASFMVKGIIDQVFPLFTPLGEKNWAEGWNPTMIFPATGQMQDGLVFQTSDHVHGAPPLTWVVATYDTTGHRITYVLTSAIRTGTISVECMAISPDRTKVQVTYTLTGLSEEGNKISEHILGKIFAGNLGDWETAVNDYLEKLKPVLH